MSRFIVEEGEGLSNSNQYTSYNEVLGYAMVRYGYEWFYKSDDCVFERDEVDRAIVSASDLIDSMSWGGCRRKKHQAMEFPRASLFNKCENCCVPCDIIPPEIKESVIILTLGILKGSVHVNTNYKPAKVKSAKFGDLSFTFSEGAYLSGSGGCGGGGMETVNPNNTSSISHLIKCFAEPHKANFKMIRSF